MDLPYTINLNPNTGTYPSGANLGVSCLGGYQRDRAFDSDGFESIGFRVWLNPKWEFPNIGDPNIVP